jgi:hypothetical protein
MARKNQYWMNPKIEEDHWYATSSGVSVPLRRPAYAMRTSIPTNTSHAISGPTRRCDVSGALMTRIPPRRG